MTALKEVFGNGLTGMNTVTSRDPHSLKDLLLSLDCSVRSCFIVVESTNMKEKLLTKSSNTVFQDLLKTANWKVGKNIFASFLAYVACAYKNCLGERRKEACEGDTRGGRVRGSLSRARSFFHPNTSKRLLRGLVMFCLHPSRLFLVYLGFVFWSRVKLLALLNSQMINSCQLIAWSCVLLELLVLVISSVSHVAFVL